MINLLVVEKVVGRLVEQDGVYKSRLASSVEQSDKGWLSPLG